MDKAETTSTDFLLFWLLTSDSWILLFILTPEFCLSSALERERSTLTSDLAELVARAEDALERRELEPARALAEQAAGVHPHDSTVHLLLGRIELAAGRPAAGVDELRSALRLDPLLVAAHRCLGYALVATGRFAEAVEQWDQWERLAARSETELAQLDAVRRAKSVAQTLGGAGAGLHG